MGSFFPCKQMLFNHSLYKKYVSELNKTLTIRLNNTLCSPIFFINIRTVSLFPISEYLPIVFISRLNKFTNDVRIYLSITENVSVFMEYEIRPRYIETSCAHKRSSWGSIRLVTINGVFMNINTEIITKTDLTKRRCCCILSIFSLDIVFTRL